MASNSILATLGYIIIIIIGCFVSVVACGNIVDLPSFDVSSIHTRNVLADDDNNFIPCPLTFATNVTRLNLTLLSNTVTMECAILDLPFSTNKDSSTGNTIPIFVRRIFLRTSDPSSSSSTRRKKVVWYLGGKGLGPGISSTASELDFLSFFNSLSSAPDDDFTLYAMDHRGVGRSSRLSCSQSQSETPGSDQGYYISAKEWPYCVKEWKLRNISLSDYSSLSAAVDLYRVLKKIHFQSMTSSPQIYFYGSSYGTVWLSRLLRYLELNDPSVLNSIKGLVFDGPISPTFKFTSYDVTQRQTVKNYLKLCNDDTIASKYDATCKTKLGGSDAYTMLKDVMKKVYGVSLSDGSSTHRSLLDELTSTSSSGGGDSSGSGHCSIISSRIPFYYIREIFGKLLLDRNTRAAIPAIIYRFNRCDSDKDVHILYNLKKFYEEMKTTDSYLDTPTLNSDAIFYNIVFSEFWDTSITESQISDNVNQSYVLKSNVYKWWKVSNAVTWPTYTLDPQYNGTIFTNPTNVPILVLSGALDSYNPPSSSEDFFNTISASNKRFISIPFALSNTLTDSPVNSINSDDCSTQIVKSFFTMETANVQQITTSCLNQLQFNFTGVESVNKKILGASDLYEGVYKAHFQESDMIKMDTFIAIIIGIIISFCLGCLIVTFVVCSMRLVCLNKSEGFRNITASTPAGNYTQYLY